LRTSRFILVAAVAIASLAAGAGSSLGGSAARTVTLDLTLDWTPNPDHVALFYAERSGMFAKAGLKVKMHAPSDPSAPMKLVGVGKTDLAISYEPELFYGAQQRLPAIAVAALIPVPLNSLIAHPDSRVRRLADLKGKSVGITGIPSDEAIYLSMLRKAGLTRADVKSVNVGYNLLTSILSRKVDAIIGGYRNVEAIELAMKLKRRPLVMPVNRLGVPSYNELVVVANSKRLGSDAEYAARVRTFLSVLVRAQSAAAGNPPRATEYTKASTQYDDKFLERSVPVTLGLMKPAGRAMGCMSSSAWQGFANWMLRTGLIKKRVAVSTVMTTEYLPRSCGR
jgi:putative hydroxymethylpyrimidine transport system substrate-binding protein